MFTQDRGFGSYGEEWHLCNVSSSTVVFLDADTIVKKDLVPLFEGYFDFSARRQFPTAENAPREIDDNIWFEIFRSNGKRPVPMPNAGFMIFKNFCHHRSKEKWLRYINDDKLPNACLHSNPKEQTVLTLALDGAKIRWLTVKEHAFRWLNEQKTDTYVLHGFSIFPEVFGNTGYDLTKSKGQAMRRVTTKVYGRKQTSAPTLKMHEEDT